MNNMTQKEKAKAYDKALENIKKLVSCGLIYEDAAIQVFPELKESEDEIIRKELIGYFTGWNDKSLFRGFKAKQILAWLEKQGEQKIDDDDKAILENWEGIVKDNKEKWQLSDWFVEATLSLVQKIEQIGLPKSIVDNNKTMLNACINTLRNVGHSHLAAWLEKQGEKLPFEMKTPEESLGIDSDTYNKIVDECIYGEQKPADIEELNFFDDFRKTDSEVEPKFHEDEWVVTDKNNVVHIKAIENGKYVLENTMSFTVDYVDKCWRKWTIEDAKDGDILSNGDSIVIFRGIGNEKWNDVIDYHIGLFTDSQHLVVQKNLSHWGRINEMTLHPATKEQRNTLMKAMTDASYEWDEENKELKKIEHKPNEWSEEDETRLTNTIIMLKEGASLHFNKKDITKAVNWLKFLKEKIQPQPNQEWSKEDERMYRGLHNLIYSTPYCDSRKELSDFLNSLKDRVQPQPNQEWSEEDERKIDLLEALIEDAKADSASYSTMAREMNELSSWLKFLEERYTWHPSDEQIEALESATENCAYSEYQDCLKELIGQLKKLKG